MRKITLTLAALAALTAAGATGAEAHALPPAPLLHPAFYDGASCDWRCREHRRHEARDRHEIRHHWNDHHQDGHRDW